MLSQIASAIVNPRPSLFPFVTPGYSASNLTSTSPPACAFATAAATAEVFRLIRGHDVVIGTTMPRRTWRRSY
jgi:hypothetical protein